jgi:hypothetical protein
MPFAISKVLPMSPVHLLPMCPVYTGGKGGVGRSEEELTGPLYEEIGRLKVEVDWLKKKL